MRLCGLVHGWKRWVVAGMLGVAAVTVGGPFIYIHFISGKAPPPLALATTDPTTASDGASVPLDGTWTVTDGSRVGYRVEEVLFGQRNEAVGRTAAVTGTVAIAGTTVRSASFTVDMTTVTSDQGRRDGQFNGRIMETATYPTATFVLSQPIDLGSAPPDGVQRTARATGQLTLHGTAKPVRFEITGRRAGSTFEVSGAIPVTFADWKIPNPSFGPVSTEDHGVLEFLMTFSRS